MDREESAVVVVTEIFPELLENTNYKRVISLPKEVLLWTSSTHNMSVRPE